MITLLLHKLILVVLEKCLITLIIVQYLGNNNLAPSDFALFWNAALNYDASEAVAEVAAVAAVPGIAAVAEYGIPGESTYRPAVIGRAAIPAVAAISAVSGTGSATAAADLVVSLSTLTKATTNKAQHFNKLAWILQNSDQTYNNYVNNAGVPKLLLFAQQNSLRTQIAANSSAGDMNKLWNAVWDRSSSTANSNYPPTGSDSTIATAVAGAFNFQGALSALRDCGFTYAQIVASGSSVVAALAFGASVDTSSPGTGLYQAQVYNTAAAQSYEKSNALNRVKGLDKVMQSSFSNESLANRLSLYGALSGDNYTLDNCAQFVKSTDSVLDVVNLLGKNKVKKTNTITVNGVSKNSVVIIDAPFDVLQKQYVNTGSPQTPTPVLAGIEYFAGQPLISNADLLNLNKLLAVAQEAQVNGNDSDGYGAYLDTPSSGLNQDYTINGILNAVRNNSTLYNNVINTLSKAYYNNAGAQGHTSTLQLDYTKTANSPAFTVYPSLVRTTTGEIDYSSSGNNSWNVATNGLFNFALNQSDVNALTLAIYGSDPLALAKILIGSISSQPLSISLDIIQSSSRNIQQALVLLNGSSLRTIIDSVHGGNSLNLQGVLSGSYVSIEKTIAYYLAALVKAGKIYGNDGFIYNTAKLLSGADGINYIDIFGELDNYFSSNSTVVTFSGTNIKSLGRLFRTMIITSNVASSMITIPGTKDISFAQLIANIMNIGCLYSGTNIYVSPMIETMIQELFSGTNVTDDKNTLNDNINAAMLFNKLGTSFYSNLSDSALSRAVGPLGVNVGWYSTWATLVAGTTADSAKRLLAAGLSIDVLLSINQSVYMFDYNTGKSVGQQIQVMLFPVAALVQAGVVTYDQLPSNITNIPAH
jgi:hypothetical protein